MKNYIEETVNELIDKYNTRDPFEILENLGVFVEFNCELDSLKGFYTVVNGVRFVVINSNLSEEEQRVVAAHELGHCCLHQHFAENSQLCEIMIYDMKSKPEYEANLFAGILLIPDEDIKEATNLGYCPEQMAAFLNTNIKLLDIRLNSK